jgi:hypothetical protein
MQSVCTENECIRCHVATVAIIYLIWLNSCCLTTPIRETSDNHASGLHTLLPLPQQLRHRRAVYLAGGGQRQRIHDLPHTRHFVARESLTDMRLKGNVRHVLNLLSGWRYKTQMYAFPVELKALQRLVHYRRPETTGF